MITKQIPRMSRIPIRGDVYDQMRATVRIIGRAIQDGARYLPIRNRAAALATTAGPKNYLGQLKAVFDDFVSRWRYVRDPHGQELVTKSPQQVYRLVMGGRSEDPGVGFGRGAGDCDDATVAIGAQLSSIGFPVRIATMAPPDAPPGRLMSHVFAQAYVPGMGWLSVDPVVYPSRGMGWTPPNSRLAFYDLAGKLIGKRGNNIGLGSPREENEMYGFGDAAPSSRTPHVSQWQDFSGFGYSEDPSELLDFRIYGLKDFGIYADSMGIIDMGDVGFSLAAEVDVDPDGTAWAPALEMTPENYNYIRQYGSPYHGMLALSDDNVQYQYDGNLGFFRKLFRKIKKKVKKIGRKLLSKIPGGKYLMRLGKKVWRIAKKVVRPLTKLVGKWAPKLAPIAALIPGYGPAISAALYSAGKVANLMNKYGAKLVGGARKLNKLRFPSGKSAKRFQRALKKAARKAKRRGLDRRFMKKLKRRGRRRSVRRARRPSRRVYSSRSARRSFSRPRRYSRRRFSARMW